MNELKHVAIIMDGNGRWAQQQHRERTYGHYRGVENVRNIAIKADELGIEVLTLYAFSTENWQRPTKEVDYLMKLPEVFFKRFLAELMAKNIRIAMIGEWERIPEATQRILKKAIAETSGNTGMVLNFAMNYGGKRELVLAASAYAHDLNAGVISDDHDEKVFSTYLESGSYPDVDLMIRTGNEHRISNFLLWKLAYAELAFVSWNWPEYTPERFAQTVDEYRQRDRRFGGLK